MVVDSVRRSPRNQDNKKWKLQHKPRRQKIDTGYIYRPTSSSLVSRISIIAFHFYIREFLRNSDTRLTCVSATSEQGLRTSARLLPIHSTDTRRRRSPVSLSAAQNLITTLSLIASCVRFDDGRARSNQAISTQSDCLSVGLACWLHTLNHQPTLRHCTSAAHVSL